VANKITDLTNKNAPTTNNPDGSLKDQVYVASVVTEVGSKALARFIQDLLSPFHRLVNKWLGGLDGVTDEQLGTQTQFFDALDTEIKHQALRVGVQGAVENWRDVTLTDGPASGNFPTVAFGAGVWVLIWEDASNIYAVVYDGLAGVAEYVVKNSPAVSPGKLFFDGTNFVLMCDKISGESVVCYTSPDGITWTERTTQAADVYEINQIGTKLVALAFSSANNRVITSDNNGVTWAATDLTPTSPLYKPTASASNGSLMIWADQDESLIRISSDGTTWQDCTISGGTLNGSYNAVWDGEHFVVFDKSNGNYFISEGPAHTTFTKKTIPHALGAVTTAFALNGVIYCIDVTSGFQLTSTVEKVLGEDWVIRAQHPSGTTVANSNRVALSDYQALITGFTSQPKDVSLTAPVQ
jgi:hypothetical protein